jgi:peptide/nickel transport system permease protein
VSRYILRRILLLIPVLFGVSLIVFMVMHLSPGDPAVVMLGPTASEADVQQIRQQLGLDRPLYVQYGRWIGNVVQGDFGRSITMRREVLPEILTRFKATLILTAASLGISTILGVGIGVISAVKQYSWFDRGSMLLALLGVSMPVFWLGIMLMVVFSLHLGWLPAGGMYSAGVDRALGDLLRHLVLPAFTLAAASVALVARITRSMMLEVIRQDYIRTARAKGLTETVTIVRHALKNALIPVVTVLGLQTGYLLGGAILTETVFSWPGLGLLMVQSITARDFPVVQGGVLLIALTFVLVNLFVDVLYAYLDPRIRYV